MTGQQKRDLASTVGVKFIELQHNMICKTERRVHSFQAVHVTATEVNGRRHLIAEYTKNGDGQPAATEALVFYPGEFDVGTAHLVDTPYNRRLIAAAIAERNAEFTIVDQTIRAEIDKLGKEYLKDPATIAFKKRLAEMKASEARRHAEEAKARKQGDVVSTDSSVAELTELVKAVAHQTVAAARNPLKSTVAPIAVDVK